MTCVKRHTNKKFGVIGYLTFWCILDQNSKGLKIYINLREVTDEGVYTSLKLKYFTLS